jgi:ABC-type branched-subunit amino acid transport system ATPase component/branched-subunit amino acid ABC-type transport system permease component
LKEVIQFAILGLGLGGVYALLAEGVVLVYRASGVLNLAHGGLALFGAFAYYDLTQLHGNAWYVGLVISVILTMIVAGAFQILVLRRMRRATPLARAVATIALLAIIQAAATLKYGGLSYIVPSFLPTNSWKVDGVTISQENVYILIIGAVGTAAIWAVSRYTLIGLATSAVAQNERAAAAVGWSPNTISLANWCIGGGLAGAAGILVVPIIELNVSNLVYLVMPALAAALLAQFRSYLLTFVGALVVGIIESELTNYTHVTGLPQAVPFLVIIVVLTISGRSLPLRSFITDRLPTLGTGRIHWIPTVILTAALAVILLVTSANVVAAITASLVAALFALSLVVLTGYAGQLSLAQYSFGGVGALVAATLVASHGWPFLLAIVAGLVVSALAGVILAVPSFRTRGINLALVTLGAGLALQDVIFGSPTFTGGLSGLTVSGQSIFGISIDPIVHPSNYGIFCLVVVVLGALVVCNLRRGRAGRRLIAVRTNERAAASLGINVIGAKTYAFSVSAGLAGVGGILLAFEAYSITFTQYDPITSIGIIGNAFIGGIGYVVGAFLGSTLTVGGMPGGIIQEHFSSFNNWLVLIGGVSLLLILIQDPNGLASQNIAAAKAIAARVRPKSRRASSYEPADVEESEKWAPQHAALNVTNLSVHFGAVKAVDGASMSVEPGQVVALIGPNGAGKTTFVDAVTGFVNTDIGEVVLGSADISKWSAHRRARAGLVRSFQSLELFDGLTVMENLLAASDSRDFHGYFSNLLFSRKPSLNAAARLAIREFELAGDLNTSVSDLSYGRRRLVAIARAVAVGPTVLILDEPAAGLSDRESQELGTLIRRLADSYGIAVLLIEHDMALVMSISDKIVALSFGQVIASGTPEEVRSSPVVTAAYLGTPAPAAAD